MIEKIKTALHKNGKDPLSYEIWIFSYGNIYIYIYIIPRFHMYAYDRFVIYNIVLVAMLTKYEMPW